MVSILWIFLVAPLAQPTQEVSELQVWLQQYRADNGSLGRTYRAPMSKDRWQRLYEFHSGWLRRLDELDFGQLNRTGQVDAVLFRSHLRNELALLEREKELDALVQPWMPFWESLVAFSDELRRRDPVDPERAAHVLTTVAEQVSEAEKNALEKHRSGDGPARTVAHRAARRLDELRSGLRHWHRFYDGYDPLFTWWVNRPFEAVQSALDQYADSMRKTIAGVEDRDTLIGEPIGAEGLANDLAHEMIPYTPSQLVAIAEEEFAWCDAQMDKASRELGFGDDWRAAQEHVKTRHVEPGGQPQLIRQLADEAVGFLEQRDLLTIPELCKETWRMEMMSPERQKVNPYFTGGEVISISFPTGSMEHDDKLMSLRGNNVHFSRAVVHHELIPGHHLQTFMRDRHRSYRRLFGTPFWLEGWALYWELYLWELDFPRSPEDRVGMLFWRKHRCARIIFSLRYHLGEFSAQEAIEFLIERVGHERNNATAEVRRSIIGNYPPLYQAAYMLGGLQLRALHREMVGGGKMSDKAFHDFVLQQNSIPIEMVRAGLTDEPLQLDHEPSWLFAGPR